MKGRSSIPDEIQVGDVFLYRGPRRWFRERRSAPGQLLARDDGLGVIHVATYLRFEGQLLVELGHLPLVRSAFARSVVARVAPMPLPESTWAAVQAWRSRRLAGEAGAFTDELHRAEALVWETVRSFEPEAAATNRFVESAYPVRDRAGEYRTVEVVAARRTLRTRADMHGVLVPEP